MAAVTSDQVKLEENGEEAFSAVDQDIDPVTGKKKKKPRRIIHFSDGIVEEYSTDEEEEPPKKTVDTKSMGKLRFAWHLIQMSACRLLAGADFLGEKFAWFLGITSPKYQYAIDEFHRIQEEEEEEKKREEREEEARRKRETQKVATLEEGVELSVQSSKEEDKIPPQNGKEGYDNYGLKY